MRSAARATYDTWSMFYEHDGLDQDRVFGADQGTNGIDDNGINGVDDVTERETSPPTLFRCAASKCGCESSTATRDKCGR